LRHCACYYGRAATSAKTAALFNFSTTIGTKRHSFYLL
jgi:hypothetical protein